MNEEQKKNLLSWSEIPEIDKAGYKKKYLNEFLDYLDLHENWDHFFKRTEKNMKNKQIKKVIHNFAVMKCAAFFHKKFRNKIIKIHYQLSSQNSKISDLKLVLKGEKEIYIEVKTKQEEHQRERETKELGLKLLENISNEGHYLNYRIKSHLAKMSDLPKIFTEINNYLLVELKNGKQRGKNEYIAWKIDKCKNKGGQFSRITFPYLEFWKNGKKPILDYAQEQISNEIKKAKTNAGGMIILDFTHLSINVQEVSRIIREWENKHPDTGVIVLRHPGLQEPSRKTFLDDFFRA